MADGTLLKERLQQATEVTAPARRLDDVVRRARVLRWRRSEGSEPTTAATRRMDASARSASNRPMGGTWRRATPRHQRGHRRCG